MSCLLFILMLLFVPFILQHILFQLFFLLLHVPCLVLSLAAVGVLVLPAGGGLVSISITCLRYVVKVIIISPCCLLIWCLCYILASGDFLMLWSSSLLICVSALWLVMERIWMSFTITSNVKRRLNRQKKSFMKTIWPFLSLHLDFVLRKLSRVRVFEKQKW